MSVTTNYNDGKWHGWNGGDCPVHPKTMVEIATHGGVFESRRAEHTYWDEGVVAFRVVKEYREPREFWLSCGIAFSTEEYARRQYPSMQPLHVREVLE